MARMFGWIGVFIDRVDRALQGRKREPRARFVFWVLVFGHLPDWKCLILCLWNRACARIGNASFFAFGIALAPVAVVLLAVATVPVIAALLGYFLLGELADRRVWATIVLVFSGILMSVAGDIERGMNIDFETLLGACCGLAVAISLAILKRFWGRVVGLRLPSVWPLTL